VWCHNVKKLKKELGATKSISIQANEVVALDTKCEEGSIHICALEVETSPHFTRKCFKNSCVWMVCLGENVEANIRHQRNNFWNYQILQLFLQ